MYLSVLFWCCVSPHFFCFFFHCAVSLFYNFFFFFGLSNISLLNSENWCLIEFFCREDVKEFPPLRLIFTSHSHHPNARLFIWSSQTLFSFSSLSHPLAGHSIIFTFLGLPLGSGSHFFHFLFYSLHYAVENDNGSSGQQLLEIIVLLFFPQDFVKYPLSKFNFQTCKGNLHPWKNSSEFILFPFS